MPSTSSQALRTVRCLPDDGATPSGSLYASASYQSPAWTVSNGSTASGGRSFSLMLTSILPKRYRSPSSSADPFVKIGSHVEPDTVVCIIEAMKLMNDIQAETAGEVVKIYVENGQPVEYGQPLFGIRT